MGLSRWHLVPLGTRPSVTRFCPAGRPFRRWLPTDRRPRAKEGARSLTDREEPGGGQRGRWFAREKGIFTRFGFWRLLPLLFLETIVKKPRC